MPEVVLDRSRIVSVTRQLEASGMPQHVRVCLTLVDNALRQGHHVTLQKWACLRVTRQMN